jgi:hypothetical protein
LNEEAIKPEVDRQTSAENNRIIGSLQEATTEVARLHTLYILRPFHANDVLETSVYSHNSISFDYSVGARLPLVFAVSGSMRLCSPTGDDANARRNTGNGSAYEKGEEALS